MRRLIFLLALTPVFLMSAEQAYPPTPPGKVEIKTLPAGLLLESRGEGSYFSGANNLFGPLFRYISRQDIAMTTPVEARIDPGTMYFWVGKDEEKKVVGERDGVRVIEMPARRVAAAGFRGGYSEEHFREAKAALLEWLETNPEVKAVGEPFGVFWNGPMTPWFLKTFEVQVLVEETAKESGGAAG